MSLRKMLRRSRRHYREGGMQLMVGQIRYQLFGDGSLIEEKQLRPVFRQALAKLESVDTNVGDYLEFGVSQGSSIKIISSELQRAKQQSTRIFGFDSFEGMPSITDTDDEGVWSAGDFAEDKDRVHASIASSGADMARIHLEKGWFENTCTPEFVEKHNVQKASLIMVDCDIYTSTVTALDFCEPMIKDHCVIVFDDWNSGDELASRNLGEKKAFDEFLIAHPDISAEQMASYSFYGLNNGVAFYVTRASS